MKNEHNETNVKKSVKFNPNVEIVEVESYNKYNFCSSLCKKIQDFLWCCYEFCSCRSSKYEIENEINAEISLENKNSSMNINHASS